MDHTHFTLAIIWRFLPKDHELEFLVIDYYSTDPNTGVRTERQVKFPGGTNAEHKNEPPEQTIVREVHEETGLEIEDCKQIWKKVVSRDHTKYGFLVNIDNCRGHLRSLPMVENGNELEVPYWFPAKTLGRNLFHSHQEAYLAACRDLGIL